MFIPSPNPSTESEGRGVPTKSPIHSVQGSCPPTNTEELPVKYLHKAGCYLQAKPLPSARGGREKEVISSPQPAHSCQASCLGTVGTVVTPEDMVSTEPRQSWEVNLSEKRGA